MNTPYMIRSMPIYCQRTLEYNRPDYLGPADAAFSIRYPREAAKEESEFLKGGEL